MPRKITRKTELSKIESVREQLQKRFNAIDKGFMDQHERSDDILDYWDIYACKLGARQLYAGESRSFLPFVRDAIRARRTRFTNQVFPQAGRYIEVTSEDGEIPHAMMALAEYYIEEAQLRTQIIPALFVQGDVEGQMTVLVSWETTDRHIVVRESKPVSIGGIEMPELGEVEEVSQQTITDGRPKVEIIPDCDYLLLPPTADTTGDALANGGSITVIRRWNETKIDEMIDRGEIREDQGEALKGMMGRIDPPKANLAKALAGYAGIRGVGENKSAYVYRTWTMVKIPSLDGPRLVLAYYGGYDLILGCHLCPYWNDKPDVISQPVEKLAGLHKGQSLVKPVADIQYQANDYFNEAADSATRALLPIVATDPEKNPRVSSMVLDMGAVWETSPRDTSFMAFPALYEKALPLIEGLKAQIFQSLSVNPSMIPQRTSARKPTQAEIAAEQAVDLLTVSDVVTNMESGNLTPIIGLMMDYDYQFRDRDLMVRSFGDLGVKAEMVAIPPQQAGKRWRFRWFGVEAARAAAQIQQQISAINVIMPMTQHPSIAQSGYRMDLVPLVRSVVESAFGPRLAPEIFKSIVDEFALDPELENELLIQGLDMPISPLDNFAKHMQAHVPLLQQFAPLTPAHAAVQKHVQAHQQGEQVKQLAAMMAQAGGPSPIAGPQARGPRRGAAPQPPRGPQQPPGAIHADRMPMAGSVVMPRKV